MPFLPFIFLVIYFKLPYLKLLICYIIQTALVSNKLEGDELKDVSADKTLIVGEKTEVEAINDDDSSVKTADQLAIHLQALVESVERRRGSQAGRDIVAQSAVEKYAEERRIDILRERIERQSQRARSNAAGYVSLPSETASELLDRMRAVLVRAEESEEAASASIMEMALIDECLLEFPVAGTVLEQQSISVDSYRRIGASPPASPLQILSKSGEMILSSPLFEGSEQGIIIIFSVKSNCKHISSYIRLHLV